MQFTNIIWVLVNGILLEKTTYQFHSNFTLTIVKNDNVFHTQWQQHESNVISFNIDNETKFVTLELKEEDILILKNDTNIINATFLNEASTEYDINTPEDVQKYLHKHYLKKVKTVIEKHHFYYIENATEFGPFTVKSLLEKVKNKSISEHCFVRDINEIDYSKKIRIRDLLKAF